MLSPIFKNFEAPTSVQILKSWAATLYSNKLAHNAGWTLIGQGFCLVIQAVYFLIIARSLGAQQYGAFVAATAFTQILSPFVGFGTDNLLVKHVSRNRNHFPVYYGNLLFATLLSGGVGSVLFCSVASVVLPTTIPMQVVLLISVAELVFSRLVDCAAMAFQAIERLDVTAKLKIWAALARLIGIIVLATYVKRPNAGEWSFLYLLATASTAIVGLIWVQVKIGAPRLALARFKEEFVEGLYFSGSLSAQSIYNDIDKTMLARFSNLDATGIYAAAYRFVEVAFIPIRSLLNAAYPGFFRAGALGIQGALSYMGRLLPKSVAYSCFAGFFLFLFAPMVPHIFGPQYARSSEALRWLAVLPLLKTIHYFLADTLTCSGHQGCRMLIQVLIAGFNIVINLWIIPVYSWRGAAWASIASDAILALSMCIGILALRPRPVLTSIGNESDLGSKSA